MASADDSFFGTIATTDETTAIDGQVDLDDLIAAVASFAEAVDPDDTATASYIGEGSISVANQNVTDFPQLNSAGLAMASGLGENWTSLTAGTSASAATFLVLPDPQDPSVTSGACTANFFSLIAAGGPGASGSTNNNVGLPSGLIINLTNVADGNGFVSSTVSVNETVVYSSSDLLLSRIKIEFPVSVGDTVFGDTSELATASAVSGVPGASSGSCNCTSHTDLRVAGIDPNDPPNNVTRVIVLEWDEENEQWVDGDTIWTDE